MSSRLTLRRPAPRRRLVRAQPRSLPPRPHLSARGPHRELAAEAAVATMAARSSVATEVEAAPSRPRRPSTRAVTAKVAAFAAAGTLALGAGLSWQMTRGADPALGPKATLAAPPKPAR